MPRPRRHVVSLTGGRPNPSALSPTPECLDACHGSKRGPTWRVLRLFRFERAPE